MNIDLSKIFIDDYDYSLPEEKIALYPLKERDDSKLLIYRDGEIRQERFFNIPDCLDEDSLIVLNDTKVIPARLLFTKNTGAEIEIFCLTPPLIPPQMGRERDWVGMEAVSGIA